MTSIASAIKLSQMSMTAKFDLFFAIQIPPRRDCKCTVEGTEVLLPFRQQLKLSAHRAGVLPFGSASQPGKEKVYSR
jgi:hypothetical protein